MTRRSIAGLFTEGRAADQIVAINKTGPITLARFQRDVAANATRIREAGCRRGLLACTDTYWAAVGLLGLFHAGASAVMPQNLKPDSLALIDDQWDFIIADVPQDDTGRALTLETADEMLGTLSLPALHPDACSLDLFTSGSTGQPKRITKSLRLLENEARAVEQLFGPRLTPDSRIHATVSHQHLYGLTFGLIWPLFSGRPFHGETHQIWETLLALKIGHSMLVTSPAHLTRLAGFRVQPTGEHPAIILSAGSPLPAGAVQETIGILGTAPTEIFGSTETGAIAWRDWGSADPAWTPLPSVRVEQLADGRMSVLSPFVAGDGRHDSADLIALAEDGTFRALGRSDSIVKIEGKRASLPELESELQRLPQVAAAAVILLAGERPRLGAVVVPTAQGQAELAIAGSFRFGQKLRRQLASRFESVVLPKQWRFVSELPSGGLGKRRVSDLLSLFDAQEEKMTASDRPDEPELHDQRKTADGIELDLFIPPTLSHLDGHFPKLPIVPGVAQIDWAAKYAARHLHLGNGVAMSFQVKFRRLMSPGSHITLVLSHHAERRRMSFTYQQQDQVLASGSFALGIP